MLVFYFLMIRRPPSTTRTDSLCPYATLCLSNYEYQSTNEELRTSKEELQSLNEELTALNSQLQEALEQQRSTSNYLQNVLYSTNIATLFLDPDRSEKHKSELM